MNSEVPLTLVLQVDKPPKQIIVFTVEKKKPSQCHFEQCMQQNRPSCTIVDEFVVPAYIHDSYDGPLIPLMCSNNAQKVH